MSESPRRSQSTESTGSRTSVVRDSLLEPGMSHGETEASSEGDDDPNHPPDEVLWTADGTIDVNIEDGDEDAIADLPSDGGQGPGGPHVYSLLGTGSSAGASGGGGSGEWSGALPGTTPKRGNGSNVPQARRVGGSSGSVRPFSVFRTEENLPSTNKTDERVVTLKKPDAGSSYGFTLKTARIPKRDPVTRRETGAYIEPTYVETVNPKGPGYAAGLRAGDHILNIDHYQVDAANHDHIVKLLKESRGRPELRLVVKYTSDFRRVEINRKLNNCTSEIMNKKAELGRIEQMETALEAARKAGTFNDVATAFHKQALLLAARHAEEKEAAKRHVFSHCDPEGCWNLYTAEQSLAIATAREASPLRGSMILPGLPAGALFEVRWGLAATSAKVPEPPATGMIQVNKTTDNTRVVKCEIVGPASPAVVAAPSPTPTPPKAKARKGSSSSVGSAMLGSEGGGGAGAAETTSVGSGSGSRSSPGSPRFAPPEDLCTFSPLDVYPASEWDTKLPLLVLAMQDQWKAERVKWEKKEADLLMKMARVEAIATQRGKELSTLAAISKAKASSPTYVAPPERTSFSAGRQVLNLDVQEGRPESEVDASVGARDNVQPASPTQATINNRVSWSGIGTLPEESVVTATAAAAMLGAASSGGDAPESNPADRPRKYTATEWV